MFVHISSKKSPLISKGKNVVFFMIRKNTVYDKLVFFLVPLSINSFPRIDYFLARSYRSQLHNFLFVHFYNQYAFTFSAYLSPENPEF